MEVLVFKPPNTSSWLHALHVELLAGELRHKVSRGSRERSIQQVALETGRQPRYVEIDEQSLRHSQQLQVCQGLRVMDGLQSVNRLQLDEELVLDQEVGAVLEIQAEVLVVDGDGNLAGEGNASQPQFVCQTALVHRLEQTRTERFVDLDGTANDLVRESATIDRHELRPLQLRRQREFRAIWPLERACCRFCNIRPCRISQSFAWRTWRSMEVLGSSPRTSSTWLHGLHAELLASAVTKPHMEAWRSMEVLYSFLS